MQLRIDPDNGTPIYEQIARQIQYSIAEGTLIPGQLIPSVRELAKRAAINPNTVQRAYLDLQNAEVIESVRGRGMAVCAGAKRRCVAERQTQLRERLETLVKEAVHSGLEADQLRSMFEKAIQQTAKDNT
ncbi:MAG: GntR family transcriptional regulator [Pirellulaceae bacterium]|nr:GntR family transcriptional regulator [Pirellulaceae bacterium]